LISCFYFDTRNGGAGGIANHTGDAAVALGQCA
jgi:hypothetical protein